jgi:glycosyltransferase 2 family protein
LAQRFDLGRAAGLIGRASPTFVAATLVVLAAASALVAMRWHLILEANAASPGRGTLLKLVFVGLFFNQVLPTGIGGDAVRAWRCRKLGIALGAAVRSVLLDRACGYFVLIVLYASVLPSLLNVFPQTHQQIALVGVFAAAMVGLLALVTLDYLPRTISRLRVIGPLVELSRESRRLLMNPRFCGAVLSVSVITLALSIIAFKLAGDAVGSRLPLEDWIIIVPPVTLIQLLPVSLAGWGVRELALVVALGPFGVPAESALATSLLMGFGAILVGLPGSLIWLADWDIAQKTPRLTTGAYCTRRRP